jgi:hypothetical protein
MAIIVKGGTTELGTVNQSTPSITNDDITLTIGTGGNVVLTLNRNVKFLKDTPDISLFITSQGSTLDAVVSISLPETVFSITGSLEFFNNSSVVPSTNSDGINYTLGIGDEFKPDYDVNVNRNNIVPITTYPKRWIVDTPGILDLKLNGDNITKIIALKAGKVRLTCVVYDYRNTTKYVDITITDSIPQTGSSAISLSSSYIYDAEVFVGKTTQAHLCIRPLGVTYTVVSWSSDTPSVAVVDQTGKITGISAGDYTLTATVSANGIEYQIESQETQSVIQGISTLLPKMNYIQMNLGDTIIKNTLTISELLDILPADATTKDLIITSSDETILTVEHTADSNGVEKLICTGISSGIANINFATLDGTAITTSITVNVYAKLVNFSLNIPDTMFVGTTFNPTVIATNSDNKPVSFLTKLWAIENVNPSSGIERATISSDGIIRAVSPGEVEVTFTVYVIESEDFTGNSNIIVVDSNSLRKVTYTKTIVISQNVTSIQISPVSANIDFLNSPTATLNATVFPSTAANTGITWASLNPSIASIPANSTGTSVVVTGLTSGTATITATSADTGNVVARAVMMVGTTITGVTLIDAVLNVNTSTSTQIRYALTPSTAIATSVLWNTEPGFSDTDDSDGTLTNTGIYISPTSLKSTYTIGIKTLDQSTDSSAAASYIPFSISVTNQFTPVPLKQPLTTVIINQVITRVEIAALALPLTINAESIVTYQIFPGNIIPSELTWDTLHPSILTIIGTNSVTTVAGTVTVRALAAGTTTLRAKYEDRVVGTRSILIAASPPLQAVQGFISTATTSTTISLTWTGITDAVYTISYKLSSAASFTNSPTINNVNNYLLTGLVAGGTYQLKISYTLNGNTSSMSNVIQVTTNPPAPTDFIASRYDDNNTTKIILYWRPPNLTYVDSFQIRYGSSTINNIDKDDIFKAEIDDVFVDITFELRSKYTKDGIEYFSAPISDELTLGEDPVDKPGSVSMLAYTSDSTGITVTWEIPTGFTYTAIQVVYVDNGRNINVRLATGIQTFRISSTAVTMVFVVTVNQALPSDFTALTIAPATPDAPTVFARFTDFTTGVLVNIGRGSDTVDRFSAEIYDGTTLLSSETGSWPSGNPLTTDVQLGVPMSSAPTISVIVKAKVSLGNIDSPETTLTITAPLPVVIETPGSTDVTDDSITVKWTTPSVQPDSYNIYYSMYEADVTVATFNASAIASPSAIATQYTITGLITSTIYYVAVTQIKNLQESNVSIQSYTTPKGQGPPPPPAVTGFISTAITDTSISLSWNEVTGVTEYFISYQESQGQIAGTTITATSPPYTYTIGPPTSPLQPFTEYVITISYSLTNIVSELATLTPNRKTKISKPSGLIASRYNPNPNNNPLFESLAVLWTPGNMQYIDEYTLTFVSNPGGTQSETAEPFDYSFNYVPPYAYNRTGTVTLVSNYQGETSDPLTININQDTPTKTVPSPVTNLGAVRVTGGINVTWSNPNATGNFTGFVVTYIVNNVITSIVLPSNSTGYVISGASPAEYVIEVITINGAVRSTEQNYTLLPFTPDPISFNIGNRTSTTITVEITPAQSQPFTYSIYYSGSTFSSINGIDFNVIDPVSNQTTTTIINLTPNTAYYIAVTQTVNGVESALNVTQTATLANLTIVLSNPDINDITTTSINVSWVPPSSTVLIESYNLYYTTTQSELNANPIMIQPVTPAPEYTALNYVINNLTVGTQYYVGITYTSSGTESSLVQRSYTTLAAPGTPVINSVTLFDNDNEVRVVFTIPTVSTGEATIDKYLVSFSGPGFSSADDSEVPYTNSGQVTYETARLTLITEGFTVTVKTKAGATFSASDTETYTISGGGGGGGGGTTLTAPNAPAILNLVLESGNIKFDLGVPQTTSGQAEPTQCIVTYDTQFITAVTYSPSITISGSTTNIVTTSLTIDVSALAADSIFTITAYTTNGTISSSVTTEIFNPNNIVTPAAPGLTAALGTNSSGESIITVNMTGLNSQASQTYTVNAAWSSSSSGAVNKSNLVLTGPVNSANMSVEINETLASGSERVLDLNDIYTITATITQSGLTSIPSNSVVVNVQPSVQVTSMKTVLPTGVPAAPGVYNIEFEWRIINTDLYGTTTIPTVGYSMPPGGTPADLIYESTNTPGLRKSTLPNIDPLTQYTIQFTNVGSPTTHTFTTGSIPTLEMIIVIPDTTNSNVTVYIIDSYTTNQNENVLIDWSLSTISFTSNTPVFLGTTHPGGVGIRIIDKNEDSTDVTDATNTTYWSVGRFTIGGLDPATTYTFTLDLKNSVGRVHGLTANPSYPDITFTTT